MNDPRTATHRNGERILFKEASPHLRRGWAVRKIMGLVLLALMPAIVASFYYFGSRVFVIYLSAIAGALLCDVLAQLLRYKRYKAFDLSPVVTGALLAMSMPVTAPFWMPALGAALGILVAKELFGGIGWNFLNPALFGRGVLRLVFADSMSANPAPIPPFGFGAIEQGADALSSATPLALFRTGQSVTDGQLRNAFLGDVAGKLGETSAVLLLLGGLFLLAVGIIRWRAPLAMFATMALMAAALGGPAGFFSADWRLVVGHLISGATMLGGFFMITDYGSSPSAPSAQWLFGTLCGVATMLFRLYGPWPEGFTFAILIVNCFVPLMNRYMRPRVLGEKVPVKTENLQTA